MQTAIIGFKENIAVHIEVTDKFLRWQLETPSTLSYVVGLSDIRIQKIIYFGEMERNINQLYLFEKF